MDRILYFVGAGLTKSLQRPERPVPMMNDFISVMADYLHDDIILTTLSALELLEDPYPYEYRPPGMADVAKPLACSTDRSLGRRAEFKRALKNRPAESIERLLENSLTNPRGRSCEVVPTRFRYGINRVFQIIGWDLNLLPLIAFVRGQLASAGSQTFVSFNYDLVLDYVLSRELRCLAPEGLYGFAGKTCPSRIARLIKPHGSLNFIGELALPYKHTQYGIAFEPRDPEILRTESGELCYWSRSEDRQREPCIVPPVASKPAALKALGLTFLEGFRTAEKQAIESADVVYIIGWSIPKTDEDQRNLIRESRSGKAPRQLVVVNRGASPDYFSDVADLFGVDINDMKIYNAGFCEFVEDTAR